MPRTNQPIVIDSRSGLILEGGGMRGVFTCGVLDNLLDRGIHFPYTIGVSAGACNGLSYLSKQRGRARQSNIELLDKYRYIGFKQLILKGCIMDFDLLFDAFPHRIIPYDFEAYRAATGRIELVTTDCRTGKACYFEERESHARLLQIARASCSLPFVCPICAVDGSPMLDGGIADSIPLLRAREQGFDRNVVVLTRNRGYRKDDRPSRIPPFVYHRYPALREAIRQRNMRYNRQLEQIEELEARGELTVIRPEAPIRVGRMERDTRKLIELYEEGYRICDKLEFEI